MGSLSKNVEKMWKYRPFFQAEMAGLGKYSTGRCGRIGVYMYVITTFFLQVLFVWYLDYEGMVDEICQHLNLKKWCILVGSVD